MSTRVESLALWGGVVLLASALRRYGDLGPLLSAPAAAALAGAGLALLTCGASSSAPGGDSRWRRAASMALEAGACAATVLLAHELIDRAQLLRISFAPVAALVAIVARWLGEGADARGAFAVLESVRGYRAVEATPQSLGLSVSTALVAVVAWRVWAAPSKRGATWWTALGATWIACATLRFAAGAMVGVSADTFADHDSADYPVIAVFSPLVTIGLDALTTLPLALLAARTWKLSPRRGDAPSSAGAAPRWRTAAACIAGALLSANTVLDSAGAPKGGRIAIDERHSEWEATDLELGRSFYGEETGYNFRALVDWLAASYGQARRLYDPLADATLADVDVLVLKTPTRRLAPEEIEAVQRYVRGGGGLLLIGDHTNVFGCGAVLNDIAKPYGFEFVYDCLFDQRHTFEHVWESPDLFPPHPIVASVDKVRLEVGCSIESHSAQVRPVVVGRGMRSQSIDYSASNYYPQVLTTSDMRFGQFAEVVIRNSGAGRVAALADSTFLSTFSVCLPGRRELVEGLLDWLDRREPARGSLRWLNWLGAALAALLAVSAAGRGLRQGSREIVVCAVSSLAVAALARSVTWKPRAAVREHIAEQEVHFLANSTRAIWPVDELVRQELRSYNMFFQWTLRVGAFPRLVNGPDEALATDAPLVLIDPDGLDEPALERLVEQIRAGRSVLALQSGPNEIVDRLASASGMSVKAPQASDVFDRARCSYGPIELGGQLSGWMPIEGGERLVVGERSDGARAATVGAVARVGGGALAVLTCGSLFTDAAYGMRYDIVPDPVRRRLFELQYDLIDALRSRGAVRRLGPSRVGG